MFCINVVRWNSVPETTLMLQITSPIYYTMTKGILPNVIKSYDLKLDNSLPSYKVIKENKWDECCSVLLLSGLAIVKINEVRWVHKTYVVDIISIVLFKIKNKIPS